jgi:hypothetical protein
MEFKKNHYFCGCKNRERTASVDGKELEVGQDSPVTKDGRPTHMRSSSARPFVQLVSENALQVQGPETRGIYRQ